VLALIVARTDAEFQYRKICTPLSGVRERLARGVAPAIACRADEAPVRRRTANQLSLCEGACPMRGYQDPDSTRRTAMRIVWFVLLLACVASSAWAAVIPANAAASHAGQSATVEGIVSEVHTARSGKETFVDIGGVYPNQTLTVVIFEPSMSAVGDVSGLTSKTVDITGTIQMYQGKPEVIVTSREQIKVKSR
jgi:hypothetical protein